VTFVQKKVVRMGYALNYLPELQKIISLNKNNVNQIKINYDHFLIYITNLIQYYNYEQFSYISNFKNLIEMFNIVIKQYFS